MKQFIYFSLLILTTSCQFFETDKIASETFYEEEIKTIDWNCVDQYPAFSNCENFTEKDAQKECFVKTLASHVQQRLLQQKMLVRKALHDTIYLDFTVHKSAALEVTQLSIDSTITQQFPSIKDWLIDGIAELKLEAPAYKRGIPVETKFTLPVVIQTRN